MIKNAQVPAGTKESIEHPLVVIQAMASQHGHKFLAKRSYSMVLRLIVDVPDRGISRGDANAERAVSFLRFKRVQFWKCVMNPFGGIALKKLQSLGHGECPRQRNQHVNVIGDSANG